MEKTPGGGERSKRAKKQATSALTAFGPATQTWFTDVFSAPTPAQEGAWDAINRGQHALVIAPTGSGKTLAAFMATLDRLTAGTELSQRTNKQVHTLYISPLKALGVDVERNLRAPLRGIAATAERLGVKVSDVTIGIRSGDTPANERRRLITHPPDILITTPESLNLLLTSRGEAILHDVDTVILDEVHALAGTKRGAHLALSLERLEALRARHGHRPERASQRIGLSATVRPAERVANFLAGGREVSIVAPPANKQWDLQVVVPVEDMTDLAAAAPPPGEDEDPNAKRPPPSIWPHVENHIVDIVEQHNSTLVFANSRRLAERLTSHLNDLHEEHRRRDAPDEEPGEGDAETGSPPRRPGPPAQVMAQSGSSHGNDGTQQPELARAHHGSVSKEQRAIIEDDLKSGKLPCVVATSSLELGIDMGAIDIVVQVESPPSVASGLQRVGRAGHQVGAVSHGVFFPNHRGDLLETAVVVDRMRNGLIEEVADLRNPLDVLAQQIVAIAFSATSAHEEAIKAQAKRAEAKPKRGAKPVAEAEPAEVELGIAGIEVEEVFAMVRRAQPFAQLPRSAFDAVLDMLSGRYPSEEFAELRPRIVWDRVSDTISARPGAQRLVTTSGGTIPDRGLFGVFLMAGQDEGATGRRVGELDEEMVYESRVQDVFTLGTTSWRIEQITHDRVLVSPAPGQPGRLPFWKGDSPGRPAELGRAVGEFIRTLGAAKPDAARARLAEAGLEERAANNLISYVEEQRSATERLPTDRTIVVERFRDELGDWRVCLHSPIGTSVLSPWALAIERRARDRYGLEVQATATNDGIVLRVPDTDAAPPGADLMIFDPDELENIITEEVGGSALFASRFRECAARALLLPKRDPRSRSPLWQQRMRAAQLLEVAARYPEFPIILETLRECLNDVFNLDALKQLHRDIAAREVALVEVETGQPSPFAASMLFGYVGAFVYEGDTPLAEKKAAALSLDAGLLAELLGREGLSQLLDADVIDEIEANLQGFGERRARTPEQLFDLLRTAGPFSLEELVERTSDVDVPAACETLVAARRIAQVRIAGVERWAVSEDLPLLHDGLGIPAPAGYPTAQLQGEMGPIESLLLRWARTHGPFVVEAVAERYGLGRGAVEAAARGLLRSGKLVRGAMRSDNPFELCSGQVLAQIKRRTLAKLRREVEPVEPRVFANFLTDWQSVTQGQRRRGSDALLNAVDQLTGYPIPASMLEAVVLPTRIADYRPGMLDELLVAGEISWSGAGPLGENDGWIQLWPSDFGPPTPIDRAESAEATAIIEKLTDGGGWRFSDLMTDPSSRERYRKALWQLVWDGVVTNDSYAPIRAHVGSGLLRKRAPARTRQLRRRPVARPVTARSPGSHDLTGRWSLVPTVDEGQFTTQLLIRLERYGILTRGSVVNESSEGGFSPSYRALTKMEDEGLCRRGYFIEGLGAAQFALPGAVDRLRAQPSEAEGRDLVLAACDPANPYGAALSWPAGSGHRPGRKAGALVVLTDGDLSLYVERGGRSMLSFATEPEIIDRSCASLAQAVRAGWLGTTTVERADGEHVFSGRLRGALERAGFSMTPQGMRLRAS